MASTHTFVCILWTIDLAWMPAINKPCHVKYKITCWLVYYNVGKYHLTTLTIHNCCHRPLTIPRNQWIVVTPSNLLITYLLRNTFCSTIILKTASEHYTIARSTYRVQCIDARLSLLSTRFNMLTISARRVTWVRAHPVGDYLSLTYLFT